MKRQTLTSICKINVKLLICSCLCFSVLFASNSVFAAKLYKWVDRNGNVSYQDTPPPEGSKVVREEDMTLSNNNSQTATQPTQAVTVYTVENCESCEVLMLRLQNWNVTTQEQSLQDRDVQARILELSDSLEAPTLFIGDKLINDLSSSNLISELQQAGHQIESPATTQTNN